MPLLELVALLVPAVDIEPEVDEYIVDEYITLSKKRTQDCD